MRLRRGDGPSSVLPLTPQFFAAADPQVSFDGSRILFSAQRAKGDSWQIWEMAVDGSKLRQVTHGEGDCLQPKYLPQNQIVYTAVSGAAAERGSAVYVSQMDGTDAHPITFGPGNFQVETVLRSGRILARPSRCWFPARRKNRARCSRCDRMDRVWRCFATTQRPTRTASGAIELADGTIVFLEEAGDSAGGQLASIRQGALHGSRLTKSPSNYASAEQLDDTTLVVARENSGRAKNRNFDLYTFDLGSKSIWKFAVSKPVGFECRRGSAGSACAAADLLEHSASNRANWADSLPGLLRFAGCSERSSGRAHRKCSRSDAGAAGEPRTNCGRCTGRIRWIVLCDRPGGRSDSI